MLHLNSEDTTATFLNNKTHLTLMFPGKSMEQLEQVIRVNECEQSPTSSPTTPTNPSNKKRLPSNESDKSQKKVKEMNSVENTDAEEEDDGVVADIATDDFVACLLLCAVLDPTSPKIRRRREFWRQNRPANSLKLDSKYLPLGVNPTLSQASNSLVSNALAANAFSTGLASNALNLKKSLERISENVSMSMANRNALSLPQSFRNAASAAKGCKNYPQGISGLRLSAVPDLSSINPIYHGLNHQYLTGPWNAANTTKPDLSSINPNYHGLNHQYLTGPWNATNTTASSFYPTAALTAASVASEMTGLAGSLPYSSSASMQNLAAITNLPGYVGGLNPEQQFRFAQATGAAAAVAAGQTASSLISENHPQSLAGGIWPGIQQSPVNMVPFQIPSIKLESPLS